MIYFLEWIFTLAMYWLVHYFIIMEFNRDFELIAQ